MVKEVKKYVCEVCGKEGPNRWDIEDHERIPVTGLDTQVGAMFKIHPEMEGDYVLVIDFKEVSQNHRREYSGLWYQINPNDKRKPFVQINDAHITSPDHLSELTDREYESAKQILNKEIKRSHPEIVLSKGVLKEILAITSLTQFKTR